MDVSKLIRKPAVAGLFYPRDPGKLAADVDRMIENAAACHLPGPIRGAVSPHAGYQYSGHVAGHLYRSLRKQNVHTAVVISPSHLEHFDHSAVFDGDGYETPLGIVETAHDLTKRLARDNARVRLSDRGHVQSHLPRQEHALEVQLPFLQRSLEKPSLVAVVMGDQAWEQCTALGDALAVLLEDPGVVVIASTDLSHFYSAQRADVLDGRFCDELLTLDARGLYEAVRDGNCEACGAGPVIAALIAASAASGGACTVLKRAHSGEVTGDNQNVVGYMSAAFTTSG